MHVVRVSETELFALEEDWNRLAGGNPFRSFAWLGTWWQHYSAAMRGLRLDWEGYLEQLSKSHRKQLRQWQRRLFDTGQATFCTATDESGVERGWNILTDLHQRRWNKLGERGCFAADVYREFHRATTRAVFAGGRLRLHWVELGGGRSPWSIISPAMTSSTRTKEALTPTPWNTNRAGWPRWPLSPSPSGRVIEPWIPAAVTSPTRRIGGRSPRRAFSGESSPIDRLRSCATTPGRYKTARGAWSRGRSDLGIRRLPGAPSAQTPDPSAPPPRCRPLPHRPSDVRSAASVEPNGIAFAYN